MKLRERASRRGVTLLEGMISTVILLTGLVGVLQGIAVASQQNSMANRYTRASILAQELLSAIEARRLANLQTTLFTSTPCQSASAFPANSPQRLTIQRSEMDPIPPGFATAPPNGLGWTTPAICYVDFDAVDNAAPYDTWTPGYTTSEDGVFTRMVAVVVDSSVAAPQREVTYIAVMVGWSDAGRLRTVKRMSAIYNTAVNQTNLEW